MTSDDDGVREGRRATLLDEGLRLFFPAAALHAIAASLAWVVTLWLGVALPQSVPAGQWHAHEMIFGTYGAALAGFLTSAVPEWTDTRRRQGRELLLLFAAWLPGRVIGLAGLDGALAVAAVTDLVFLGLLFWYLLSALLERRSSRHASFAIWLALFVVVEAGVHVAWLIERPDIAQSLIRTALLVFLVFLSLAIARINVVIVNLALDPSGATTPYRPHPGRQNLTALLVSIYLVAALLFPASDVAPYLALAAAAAFFDRLAEWFVGAAVFKTHVVALATANALSGIGLLLIGLAGLGAPIAETTGFHVVAIGGLGLAVLDVFVIAGLRHTGRSLSLPWQAHAALAMIVLATAVRALPELGIGTFLLGMHYGLAAMIWSGAFALWLFAFMPMLRNPLGNDLH